MRLRSIELSAFGCLRDFQAELAPGLNLFHGPNEAGKSTLQHAVLALLYSFYDRDRASADETARRERFQPWASPEPARRNGEFRGRLEYELADGRVFQVRRDFSTPDITTQLIDLATGQDVASQFGHGRHGNLPFARRHLGMSRAVFQSCAFISQGEIFEVSRGASPREIGDAIASLADSARRDVSAANAMQLLDQLIKKIGRDVARTADLPRAREHLRLARQELEALDQARQALSEKAAQADDLQARLAHLQEELGRTELLLTRAQLADLAGLLQDLQAIDQALAHAQARVQELKPYASVPSHLRDEVLRLRGRRQRATETLAHLESELADANAALDEEARLLYPALQAEVGSLPSEQLQALERLAYSPPPSRGFRAGLLATLRAAGRAVVALARRLVGIVLRRTFEGPSEKPEEPPGPALNLTPAQALELLEKHRRYLTIRPAIDNLARLESDQARAAADLTAIDGQLQGLLEGASDGDLEAAIDAFLAACQRRQQHEAALAAQEEAAQRRRALLRGRSPQELERQHQLLARHVQELETRQPHLRDSESDEPPEELVARLEALRREREQAQLRHTQLKTGIDHAFAQHRPRPEIEEEIERWQREAARLERARAAAELAKTTIEEAVTQVYRDFAPRVNEFLSQGVDYVTQGRYKNAFVDPSTLKISIEVPEIDRVITDPPVSHGTRTLVYVLMRIGLAQHMSSIGEPVPLVLDDPFVDIDGQRLPRLLDFLARLSHERGIQVLLFSKDENTLRWFQDAAADPDHRLHPLPSPTEAPLPALAADGRLL